ncbi:MAG: hypothetical protein R8M70_02220 [Alphaproteobacteria bacterium]|nr:hypothetical protein [Alphaproteobacteria bacterium]
MIKFIIMKRVFLAILIVVFAVNVRAEELTGHYDEDGLFYDDYVSSPADDALDKMYDVYEAVQTFCGGLSADLSELSGISIANAVATGVGTATATGALATGIAKANTDKQISELSRKISERICKNGGCDAASVENMSDEEFAEKILPLLVEAVRLENQSELKATLGLKLEQDRAIAKSRRLGNWRTGLLAGNTATSIASAVMAGLNRDQSELILRVRACNDAVEKLRAANQAAIAAGINPIDNPYMQGFRETMDKCGTLNLADVEKIEKQIKVVMGTGIAGSVIGAVGVGTSAAANSNKVRNDNTAAGQRKEKTLNTVANVASGTNVVVGAVGTGFNISLLNLTKKLIRAANQCEDTL